MNIKEFKLLMKLLWGVIFIVMLYIIYPYIDAIALSCAFAYMVKPVFDRIKNKLGYTFGALVCMFLVIVPILVIGIIILKDLLFFFQSVNITNININDTLILFINTVINKVSGIFGYRYYVDEKTLHTLLIQVWDYITPYIKETLSHVMIIPELIIKTMIIIFMTYYFLRDGHYIKDIVLAYIPEGYRGKAEIFIDKLNESYTNLFVGNVLTSIIIGVISGIIYYLFGISNAFLLSVLTGIFALLPIIGGWAIYVPYSLYYIFLGEFWKGMGLFIAGTIFLSLVPDFLIRPHIIKQESDVHPTLVLIAFLIAPLTLGIGGFAIGPLIVGVFDAFFKLRTYYKIYDDE